jgi:hypothetical protein
MAASSPPASPEPSPHESDTGSPNPTRLPVEPEFGQEVPASDPEEPGQPSSAPI